jgi:hypothetical protein
MMRHPLATLTALATCGLLAVGVTASAGRRAWSLALSPAPNDIALAQISFHAPGRGGVSTGELRVALSAAFGSDYMVAAVPRFATPGVARALVLVVNRPSALLDPASVRLRITAPRSLGAPTVRTRENPFASADPPRGATLCDLRPHGSPLGGAELRTLASRGAPLAGFDAASAVSEAYDVACGLPHSASFVSAVEHAGSGLPPTTPPPGPEPAPAPPEPPVGKVPGEGCRPAPGYACPEAVRSASPRVLEDGARRAPAGAH